MSDAMYMVEKSMEAKMGGVDVDIWWTKVLRA